MIIAARWYPEAGRARSVVFAVGAALVVFAMAGTLLQPAAPTLVAAALLLGLAIAACAAIFAGREGVDRLLLLYIFLTPFQFAIFSDSLFPQRDETFGFRASLSDLVFPLLIMAVLQNRPGDRSFLRSRAALALGALALALTVSWAQSTGYLGTVTRFSSGKYIGLIYLIVLAGLLIEVIQERSLWQRALDALVLSGFASGIIGIAGWLAWRMAGISTYLVDFDRVNSTMFGDPNIFGSLMAVTTVLAIARVRYSPPGSRWWWIGCAAVALFALLLSQSRSGYMAAGVGLTVLALWFRPSAAVAGLTALVLLGVITWSALVWSGASPRVPGLNEQRLSGETLEARLQFWTRGASLLPKEGLSGIGIGTFQQTNFFEGSARIGRGFARAHNTYLAVPLELGLPGTVAFGLLGASVVGAVRRGRRHLDRVQRWHVAAVACSLVAMLVFALWVDALYQRHLWILVGLVLAAPACSSRTTEPAKSPTL